jgi:predicted nucleotidyltransferase
MAESINSYLSTLSYTYYISHDSEEDKKIKTSISILQGKLRTCFGAKMLSASVFGSYERDTILPRKYDTYTDVDMMVKFDHATLNRNEATYRQWLLDFGTDNYLRSASYKDFPTVVVQLSHISFDLVPAKEEGYFKTLYIPDANNIWQVTDPRGFNQTVADANGRYKYIVKPIIRLMKAWNAKAGYPFSTYALEQQIAGMNFTGDDFQSGFFWAIDHISDFNLSATGKGKVTSLRNNKAWVKRYLDENNLTKAKEWLHYILPQA